MVNIPAPCFASGYEKSWIFDLSIVLLETFTRGYFRVNSPSSTPLDVRVGAFQLRKLSLQCEMHQENRPNEGHPLVQPIEDTNR